MSNFRFEILHQSKKSRARVGRIHTPHGIIDTPGFVAVGTNGTLKALDNVMVDAIGLQLMFCNTYHLLLQPGPDIVAQAGGLHKFINRKQPLITDSGGFQVFSLAYGGITDELKSAGTKRSNSSVLKINEEGVLFRSYRCGKKVLLTPETSIQAQKKLGADIIIPFDELPPYHTDPRKLRASLERTHRWEKRSLDEHEKDRREQAMYGIVHGGTDANMRKESAQFIASENFDGCAIGGSFGKTREQMIDMLTQLMPHLPPERPVHLLGIGDLPSLQQAMHLGIDTFDSSYPTRAARHGTLLRKAGAIRISSGQYRDKFEKIEDDCTCPTCSNYTVAYLHHLYKAKEATFQTLATIHNLHFMVQLMARYRAAIMLDEI